MKRLLTVVAALVLGAGAAQAGPVTYTTPGPGDTYPNDVIGAKEGWLNANLYLVGGPATITIEYIGREAGYRNEFFFNDTLLFTNNNPGETAPGASVTVNNVPSGLLNFRFTVNNGAGGVSNLGVNSDSPAGTPNFFLSFGTFTTPAELAAFKGDAVGGGIPGGGNMVIIALDDGGGANPSDDNHDDMVIRLSISSGSLTSVPDGGATLALLGGALMGLGLIRRKLQA